MINFDDYTNENKTEHNLKRPYIPDHPCRILIIGGSRSGKTNSLLNLLNSEVHIDKIYLYAKDPCKAKCQYLINKREKVDLNHYDDPISLLNIQMICKMYIKISKNAILEKNIKY